MIGVEGGERRGLADIVLRDHVVGDGHRRDVHHAQAARNGCTRDQAPQVGRQRALARAGPHEGKAHADDHDARPRAICVE